MTALQSARWALRAAALTALATAPAACGVLQPQPSPAQPRAGAPVAPGAAADQGFAAGTDDTTNEAAGARGDDGANAGTKRPQAGSGEAAANAAAVSSRPRSQPALSIWHDAAFRRRLAESYVAVTDVEPPLSDDERATMYEVLDLVAQDNTAEALELLQQSRGPAASAVFDFSLGNIWFQQEQLTKAAAAYEIAVQKWPNFRRAWGNAGQVYFQQNDLPKAIRAFTRVLELGGGDPITYGLLGVAHARRADYVAAESAFRMAAMLDPATVDWKKGLAESFFRQGRYADAASLFHSLIEAHPDSAELWLAQGEAYARLGRPLDAAKNFEMVDTLGGSTFDSLNNLGDIYANEKLYDVAVDAYLRAMRLQPDGGPKRALRAGQYLVANNALAEARALVEGLGEVWGERLADDDRMQLLKLRARLAVAEGKGKEQISVLEQIVAADPTDGDALLQLGRYHQRQDDPEKAVLYFERAAQLADFEAEAKVLHARLLVAQSRFRDALPLLRRAQELKPRDYVQDFLEQVERRAKTQ